jgi:hypothetical protein
MCAHKCPRSPHKCKINCHPPYKHLHQHRMKSQLRKKKIKSKTMSELKIMAWIKGET